MSKNKKKKADAIEDINTKEEIMDAEDIKRDHEEQMKIREQIKAMEAAKRAEQKPSPKIVDAPRKKNAPEKISFNSWWVLRSGKIPRQHKKEIIQADFRGRKLSEFETMKTFDEALKKYGIILS